MKRCLPTVLFLFALLMATPASAARRGLKSVQVSSTRVTLSDIVPRVSEDLADVDLGRAPAPNGTRVITGAHIKKALNERNLPIPHRLPKATRVVRKMRVLTAPELRRIGKAALAKAPGRKGVVLRAIIPPPKTRIAAGWTEVNVRLPKPPRRAGKWSTSAMLTFSAGGEVIKRVALPVRFDVSADAAKPDVSKGSPLMLLVKSGLIELRVRASAGANADIGQVMQVVLRPSGRVVRAKLLSKKKAVAIGGAGS